MVIENRTEIMFFDIPKSLGYMQYYTKLLEQFDYKRVKDLATVTLLDQFVFAWPRYWASLLCSRKIVTTFHFHFIQRLKMHLFICS